MGCFDCEKPLQVSAEMRLNICLYIFTGEVDFIGSLCVLFFPNANDFPGGHVVSSVGGPDIYSLRYQSGRKKESSSTRIKVRCNMKIPHPGPQSGGRL